MTRLPPHEVAVLPKAGMASERVFGFAFTAVFSVIGLWPLFQDRDPRWWSLVIAATFLAAALARPGLLAPLNRAWYKVTRVIEHVLVLVLMGLVFVLTVVPVALIHRVRGRDVLGLKKDPETASYWIPRDPPGPDPESLRHQF